MILSSLSYQQVKHHLITSGLQFYAGRFKVNLVSFIPDIAKGVMQLYGDSEVFENEPADFYVELKPSNGIRRFYKRQVHFVANGIEPFTPLPFDQSLPLLEWGLNWCVTNHCHQYLVIHAASIAKNNCAIIMPGAPGSGKSTLCASSVTKFGWSLLSDELALVRTDNGQLYSNPRPISLKNHSIDIIRNNADNVSISPVVEDTLKGSVAHVSVSSVSIQEKDRAAKPLVILFPKYKKGVENKLIPLSKGEAFIRIADNAFNYSILGKTGFEVTGKLLDQVECYDYIYDGNLVEANEMLESLLK